jgi:hypothetical protein
MTYTDCLGPPLVLLEQTFNAQVIRDLLQIDDVQVQFDFSAVLRGDRLAEIDSLRDAVSSALMTPNEGRGVLNMPKSDDPGMDQFYLPFNNLQPVGSPPLPNMPPTTHIPGGDPSGPPVAPGARRLHVRSRDRDYSSDVPVEAY